MNIYKCLNEIAEYIENNLENKIDYEVLAKMMATNVYTLQRIFSLLTNITLSEYIRKRRLSNAGFDLYNSKSKVMDIAIKYNYDNATSFSRAFESFHGIKPSKVNKYTKLKNYPKIKFDEIKMINDEISYEVIELQELILYGKSIKTDEFNISKDAPRFWNDIEGNFKYDDLNYGMVLYEDRFESNDLQYWILSNKVIDGFDKYVIPKSKWLVFRTNSRNEIDIQKTINNFYSSFLPSCKYKLRNIPELEYYHDGITEFLVPIE